MSKQLFTDLFCTAHTVGFSGSRSMTPEMKEAIKQIALLIPQSTAVIVGDCRGVDKFIASLYKNASIFNVKNYANTAHRSISMVNAVRAANGILVVFPGNPCPSGLIPSASSSRCFCGLGSGSWASAALAVGLNIPVIIWLGVATIPVNWVFSYTVDSFVIFDPPKQLSLF